MLVNKRNSASSLNSTRKFQMNIDGNRIALHALSLAHDTFPYQ